MSDRSALPFAVIPAQAGIQRWALETNRAVLDTGVRRYDGLGLCSIDPHHEIAPALFGLRAEILFFGQAKKSDSPDRRKTPVRSYNQARSGKQATALARDVS